MYKITSTIFGALALLLSSLSPALADGNYPQLDIRGPIELEYKSVIDSDKASKELEDTFVEISPEIEIKFNEHFALEAELVFERVQPAKDDRILDDHGLFAEQLLLSYEDGRYRIFAGKFNPTFGQAFENAPGIFGDEFAEDYEITERIGFGGAYAFGDEATGTHTLSASTFFADTTFLSGSTITGRPETRLASGGVSNTEDFSSYAVSLDGENVVNLGGLNYTLGLSHQAGGVGSTEDQTGYVAGLSKDFVLSENLSTTPMIEYVYLDNAGGTIAEMDYFTFSNRVDLGPWNLSLAYTGRNEDPNTPTGADQTDTLLTGSMGYLFDNGIGIDAGYAFEEEHSIDKHILGLLLHYHFHWSSLGAEH